RSSSVTGVQTCASDLRQLVEPRLPDEAADARDPIVLVARPHGRAGLLRIRSHRAELVDPEHASVLADALLAVERRAGGVDPDGEIGRAAGREGARGGD